MDTAAKRHSALDNGIYLTVPRASTSGVVRGERQHVAAVYSGIDTTAAVAVAAAGATAVVDVTAGAATVTDVAAGNAGVIDG